MVGFDALAWTIGYVIIVFGGVSLTLSLISVPTYWAAKRLWDNLSKVYEFYVLKWWLDTIKQSGRTIPTKKNIDLFYKELEDD